MNINIYSCICDVLDLKAWSVAECFDQPGALVLSVEVLYLKLLGPQHILKIKQFLLATHLCGVVALCYDSEVCVFKVVSITNRSEFFPTRIISLNACCAIQRFCRVTALSNLNSVFSLEFKKLIASASINPHPALLYAVITFRRSRGRSETSIVGRKVISACWVEGSTLDD